MPLIFFRLRGNFIGTKVAPILPKGAVETDTYFNHFNSMLNENFDKKKGK